VRDLSHGRHFRVTAARTLTVLATAAGLLAAPASAAIADPDQVPAVCRTWGDLAACWTV
jgi:ABC-type histidine transport system ATPase subunit